MPSPVMLSSEPARPLTSHEISKVLCAIAGGVAQSDPTEARRFVAQFTGGGLGVPPGISHWLAAFVATIGGFYTWCAREEVDTAVSWVRANIAHLVPVDVPPTPPAVN